MATATTVNTSSVSLSSTPTDGNDEKTTPMSAPITVESVTFTIALPGAGKPTMTVTCQLDDTIQQLMNLIEQKIDLPSAKQV
jgi:hypothetical protein